MRGGSLGVLGAALGFALLMLHQPMRRAFRQALRYVVRQWWAVSLLVVFLTVDRLISPWEEPPSVETASWWLAAASEDAWGVIWQALPSKATFLLSVPLALFFFRDWWPKFWPERRPLALLLGLTLLMASWWWLDQVLARLGSGARIVPEISALAMLLWSAGEVVFTDFVLALGQMFLILSLYHAYASKNGQSTWREAFELTLKRLPSYWLGICVVILCSILRYSLPSTWNESPVWHALGFVLVVLFCALPQCLLLLQVMNPSQSLPASLRFFRRNSWPCLCLAFSIFAAAILWRWLDSLGPPPGSHPVKSFSWAFGASMVRAFGLCWFLCTLTLYFCEDVSGRKGASKHSPKAKPRKK